MEGLRSIFVLTDPLDENIEEDGTKKGSVVGDMIYQANGSKAKPMAPTWGGGCLFSGAGHTAR